MSKISVVIPTINTRPKLLLEAMKAIERQSYRPLEVIIVNNGIDSVALPESKLDIKVVQIIYRAGASQARNFGAVLAFGEYIAFLDDDDLWAADYLEIMAGQIEEHSPDCLIGRVDQLVDGKVIPYKNSEGLLNKDVIFLKNPGMTGSSVVVRKTAFFAVGGYNVRFPTSEDKALVLELLRQGLSVVTVPECQVIFRQHGMHGRLTDSITMGEGIYQFYRHYKKEMNLYQKAFNLFKIHKYRWESERSFVSLVVYGVFFLAYLPKRIFAKFSNSKN